MTDPFIGTEALADGLLNRHQLRTRHRAIFPGIYLRNDVPATLSRRITGASLWSGRRGIVAGLAAASTFGAKWIDDDTLIDLMYSNPRPPSGIVTHRALLLEDEAVVSAGTTRTSAARTAFDVGRCGTTSSAVARLDALFRVVAEDRPRDVLRRVQQAIASRQSIVS